MTNEKRRITYWRVMPKGAIVFFDVICEVKKSNRSDGTEYETFIDKHGNDHIPSEMFGNYQTLNLAIKAAKKKIDRAEANARATLLSCEIRRIRLEESIKELALETIGEFTGV